MRKLLFLSFILTSIAIAQYAPPPLPDNAAQETGGNLDAINGKITAVDTTNLATSAKQDTLNTTVQTTLPRNISQLNGATISTGSGAIDSGTLRTVIANGSTISLGASTAIIGSLSANQSVNVSQLAGNTMSTGKGNSDTGTQRMVLAENNSSAMNIAQLGGSSISKNTGNADSGTQRVVLAADNTTVSVEPTHSSTSGTLAALNDELAITFSNMSTVVVYFSSSSLDVTSAIDFLRSVDSTNYSAAYCFSQDLVTYSSGITGSGTVGKYVCNAAGDSKFKVKMSAYGSGSVSVKIEVNKINFDYYAESFLDLSNGQPGHYVGIGQDDVGLAKETSLQKLTLAQASTTAAQTGPLVQGAVTTSAPSYTTAKTSPLSLDINGGLRVNNSNINGFATSVGNGLNDLGTQRITLASDSNGAVKITDGSFNASLSSGAAGNALRVDLSQIKDAAISTSSGSIDSGTQRVVIGNGSTISLGASTAIIGSLSANQSTNISQVNGVTTSVGKGNSDTGTLRVVLAENSSGQYNQTQINGTAVSTGAGASDAGTQRFILASNNSSAFNQTQINGVAVSTGTGAADTGTQRVQLSDANSGQINKIQVNGVAVAVGAGATNTGTERMVLANDSTVIIVPKPIVKGTQGSEGIMSQELMNSGRTSISLYNSTITAGTSASETAYNLFSCKGTSACSAAAASYACTSGKTLRLNNVSVAMRGGAAASTAVTTFTFRINTGGAVTTTSTPVIWPIRVALPPSASTFASRDIQISEGYEVTCNGTLQIGVTTNSTYTTNTPTLDVLISGYEY